MDVSFLQPVFAAAGPYATVCADVTHTTENADAELDLRGRAIAGTLTEQGAPDAVVEAVRGRLLEGNAGGEAGADEVAGAITSMARRHSPRFVLVAGDVRARQILTDRASDVWADLVVSMDEGGRAAGADREPVDRRAAELVAEHEAREVADTMEKVEAAGAHGLAVTGIEHVVEALRKGQVETLVLADDLGDATLLVGGSPLELGMAQQDMDALGVHGEVAPADRALIEAAVAGAAAVVVVPVSALSGTPAAAVLRYTDDSTDAGQ
jgi:hypothetical protein